MLPVGPFFGFNYQTARLNVNSMGIVTRAHKVHSFLLETGAFLATWFVLDLLLQGVAWVLAGKARIASDRPSNQG
jgi:hypothetical protein